MQTPVTILHTTALISDVRCMKNTQAHHVPISRLHNCYYGGLDELIKSYDLN